ncbi:hypothetical protein BV25DRAFT_1849730 [Artomyces pyxidatus]|uniref:Uncharacterized protein n=1 Tax=Artomyces pyxidatus TaxID=48021 RepID=A0ACB8TB39_9AGAM|nr:hypothetical protein BV25DRAFT_1849730 [Artomyces pyxidatus]
MPSPALASYLLPVGCTSQSIRHVGLLYVRRPRIPGTRSLPASPSVLPAICCIVPHCLSKIYSIQYIMCSHIPDSGVSQLSHDRLTTQEFRPLDRISCTFGMRSAWEEQGISEHQYSPT